MIQEFRLPDLGEGLPEAELVQWLVAEGDRVALNQTIAEVETAKAVVELPSPHAGVVQVLHAAAGDVVEVGAPLISFDVGAEASGSRVARAATATRASSQKMATRAGSKWWSGDREDQGASDDRCRDQPTPSASRISSQVQGSSRR